MRRYFGTDGVRGVVGEEITVELVERLAKAATLWSGRGRVFVGRDTRASGPELEAALARGVTSAGGTAVLGGVLPTPAIALHALDAGAAVTASHNPPHYNGVKLFHGDGRKLTDEDEEAVEALLETAAASTPGAVERDDTARERYVDHVLARFGADLAGVRLGVDCANGAFAAIAPHVFERLGADVTAIGVTPDGANINVRCGATDVRALQQTVTSNGLDLGVAFDGDGDRMVAVDAHGREVDGDAILAVLALRLGVDLVVVTEMTNHAFHRLMADHGIRVVTTDVGDRYVLEALRNARGVLGGEQSGHLIYLDGHVTGDGLVAALLLLRVLEGAPLDEATRLYVPLPQVKENVVVGSKELPQTLREAIDRAVAGRGRVVVRRSGTEPVVRVLAEAATEEEAAVLCGTIVALVRRELG